MLVNKLWKRMDKVRRKSVAQLKYLMPPLITNNIIIGNSCRLALYYTYNIQMASKPAFCSNFMHTVEPLYYMYEHPWDQMDCPDSRGVLISGVIFARFPIIYVAGTDRQSPGVHVSGVQIRGVPL